MSRSLISCGAVKCVIILFTAIGIVLFATESSWCDLDTLWTKCYGPNVSASASSVLQTGDSGYIMVGSTYFGGDNSDLYVVRSDANGDSLWTRTYGYSAFEGAQSISPTLDGKYIIVGNTYDTQGAGNNMWLVKMDVWGDTLWAKGYGSESAEYAFDGQQTLDGGFIMGGITSKPNDGYDWMLVKTDPNGNTTANWTYGGSGNDYLQSIDNASDGGYILAGNGWATLVKVDSIGAVIWSVDLSPNSVELYSVQQTSDGGYIAVGSKSLPGYRIKCYMLKTDSTGTIQWSRAYGPGAQYDWSIAYSVQQTTDGGFIFAGFSGGAYDVDSVYIVKTDNAGVEEWSGIYGRPYLDAVAKCVRQTTDGGYIVAGYVDGDAWLLKLGVSCCDVNMTPDTYPINIFPGGLFGLTGFIANPTPDPMITDVWVGVDYLNVFYQLYQFNNLGLNPSQFLSAHIVQHVPNYAPLGTYKYVAYCGDYQSNKCDSAFFNFTVVGGRIEGGYDAWTLEGGFDAGNTPNEYAVGSFPNPFNASTTITYALPTAGNVNLEVYNLAGQKVATLVNEYNEAGQHNVTWDAANYSSGIYFCKLSAGEKVFTERMTLLK